MKTLPLLILFAPGCVEDLSCTQIGCSDGLEIELSKGSGSWEDGRWEFRLDVDGLVESCHVTLPFDSGTTADCDGQSAWLGISGTELPRQQQEITQLGTPSVGEVVLATVLHEDDVVMYSTFEPDYQRLQPNGEGCGPVCYSSSEVMAVP